MRMSIVRGLIVLLQGVLLAGCTYIGPAQPNCDEMVVLQSLIYREASPEQLRVWIADTYHISSESIISEPFPQRQAHLLQWRKNDLWYNLDIEKGVVTDIGVGARGLSAAAVIACLGQPTHYSAIYGWDTEGGKELDLDLLFPDRGVLAGGARFLRSRPEQPPAITGDFPITAFRFMRPDSASTLLQRVHSGYVPGLREQMINGYKLWPGAWKDIEIGINRYSGPKSVE